MQVWKRILSCALVGACVLLPVNQFNELTDVFAAEESTEPAVWDGTYDTGWYDSEATEMHISTAEELAGLAQLVNNGHTMTGQTIILDNDIVLNDVSNYENWETETPENKWTPIGNDTPYYFDGTFDGNEHTLSGLYINKSHQYTEYSMEDGDCILYVGLFGHSGSNSTIKNTICDFSYIKNNIYSYNTRTATKIAYVGGICGLDDGGSINHCNFSGTVTSRNYIRTESYNKAEIETLNSVGGICGYATENSIISNCISAGFVNCYSYANSRPSYTGSSTADASSYAGGVCGYMDKGSIISCGNSSLVSSTATAYKTSSTSSSACAGGICGRAQLTSVTHCYNKNTISGVLSGGILGSAASPAISNCYNHGEINNNTENIGDYELRGGICGVAGKDIITSTNKVYNIGLTNIASENNVEKSYAGGILGGNNNYTLYTTAMKMNKCYFLASSADKGVGQSVPEIAIAKNQSNMQTEAFAETLGDAFVYVEGDYPKLFWELGLALRGDVNTDGLVTVADAILLQQYLLNLQSLDEKQYEGALITEDDSVNGFDLAVLKRMLLSE